MVSMFNIKVLLLALVTLLFFRAILATPVFQTSSDLISNPTIMPHTFNPESLRDLYCSHQLNPPFENAYSPTIAKGINYLRNVKAPCDAPPRSCARVSCSYKSAIFLCNDRDDHIYITCSDVADYADWIMQKCLCGSYSPDWTGAEGTGDYDCLGQQFDAGNWNVLVRADTNHC